MTQRLLASQGDDPASLGLFDILVRLEVTCRGSVDYNLDNQTTIEWINGQLNEWVSE